MTRSTLSDLTLLLVAAIGWASLIVMLPLIGLVDAYRAVRAELRRRAAR